jgi:hypothetical protein
MGGTVLLDFWEKTRSNRISSPMTIVTRGPIYVIALTDETRPTQIKSTDDSAARRAENMSPGNLGYVELASYLINRRSIEKVRVEADVEYITVVIAMKIE